MVGQHQVDRHPDALRVGLDDVAGVPDDRQVRRGSADLGGAGGRGQQSGRGDEREEQDPEAAAHEPGPRVGTGAAGCSASSDGSISG